MGRFGRHSAVISSDDVRNFCVLEQYYSVPYNAIAEKIKAKMSLEEFQEMWEDAFNAVIKDFDMKLAKLWDDMLKKIQKDGFHVEAGQSGGLTTAEILTSYVEFGYEDVSCIKHSFNSLYEMANSNSEALRRLIKKFDKQTGMMTQSVRMLPRLYGASFTIGQEYLASIMDSLDLLLVDADDDDLSIDSTKSIASNNDTTAQMADELEWLRDNASKEMTKEDLESIVAHRGFHNNNDQIHNRPLENTLSSFEQIWTAGISLCECDIAMTRDGKIVMAHDETFERLALIEGCDINAKSVSDLTLRELLSLNLKSGNRPPLLIDCLRSAVTIGDHAKLVIEVKPGNKEIVNPLVQLFQKHEVMLSHVAVVMSFDAIVIQRVKAQFKEAFSGPFSGPRDRRSLGVRSGNSLMQMRAMYRSSQRLLQTNQVIEEGKADVYRKPEVNNRRKYIESVSYALGDLAFGNETPDLPYFLLLTQVAPSNKFYSVSVKDLSPLFDVVRKYDVDGVYIEYEPEMLDPDYQQSIIELSEFCKVGVWMFAHLHPDCISICRRLRNECGISFVNTDYVPDFFWK